MPGESKDATDPIELKKQQGEDKPGPKGSKPKGIFLKINDKDYFLKEPKELKSGGRVNLRGGGMCKKGMNKKAYGRNS